MSKLTNVSYAELIKEIERRQQEQHQLQQRAKELETQRQQIVIEIKEIDNKLNGEAHPVKKAQTRSKTLRDRMIEVLKNHCPMKIGPFSDMIRQSGYNTASNKTNLKNQIYVTASKNKDVFGRTTDGEFILKNEHNANASPSNKKSRKYTRSKYARRGNILTLRDAIHKSFTRNRRKKMTLAEISNSIDQKEYKPQGKAKLQDLVARTVSVDKRFERVKPGLWKVIK